MNCLLVPKTLREGSQRTLDFWLQVDNDGDGKPDAALVLTGFQSLELRVKPIDGSTVVSFKTTDPSPQLVVVTDDGTASAPNGVLASHVQFTPAVDDFKSADGSYLLYLVLIPQGGNPETIPEHENLKLAVFEKF